MASYRISAREIPLDPSWDVIVAGGGPAGCTAATAAAREGARTLLLEMSGALGGMGTLGLVPWFCGYMDGERILSRGLAERVRQGLEDGMPCYRKGLEKNPLVAPPIDPELLKRIYDEMVTEAGAQVRFHSQLCGVERDTDGAPKALLVSSKDGLKAYQAKVYVDCTGDADLAAWAGAEVLKGDENGKMQPATHCFMISNIDEEALARGPQIHFYNEDSPIWEAIKSDEYPLIDDLHSCYRKIGPGTYGFNTGHIYDVDNTDPASITEALLKGRQMVAQYHQLFARTLPAFKDSCLVATGGLMGIRETRRIVGDYMLTVDDYRARASFPDEICRNAYGIDVHRSREDVLGLTKLSIPELKEWNRKETRHLGKGESFGVPYRCLTPKGVDNVLVAGRCISSDRQANGTTRIMACCLNTGEAAGVAAAMAAQDSGSVHEVETRDLRKRLIDYGAYLPEVEAEKRSEAPVAG